MSQLPKDDLYQILGLTPEADQEAIDHAYKDLIRKTHPDLAKTPGEAEYRTSLSARINSAASVLRDPDRRAAYDFDRRRAAEKAEQASRQAAQKAAAAATPRPGTPPPVSTPAARSGPSVARTSYAAPSLDPADDPSFDDFFEHAHRPSASRRDRAPRTLTEWFIFNRVGQWLTLGLVFAAVFLVGNMLAARTGPLISAGEVPILAAQAVAGWLIVGALLTRDLQNPLGDLLRLAYRLTTALVRSIGSDRSGS